jgi:hypothetical protein
VAASAPAPAEAPPAEVASVSQTRTTAVAAPDDPTPAPTADAETEPLPVVSTAPLPAVSVGIHGPANAELYSKGSMNMLARFESRTVNVVGGALAVIVVFVLTYIGASLVFRPETSDAFAAGAPGLPPRQAFILEVDKMCAEASQSAMGLPPPGTDAEMANFTQRSVATHKRLVTDLRTVTPPKPDRALFKKVVARRDAQVDQLRALLTEIRSGDSAGVNATMAGMVTSEKQIDRMSKRLGIRGCG